MANRHSFNAISSLVFLSGERNIRDKSGNRSSGLNGVVVKSAGTRFSISIDRKPEFLSEVSVNERGCAFRLVSVGANIVPPSPQGETKRAERRVLSLCYAAVFRFEWFVPVRRRVQ